MNLRGQTSLEVWSLKGKSEHSAWEHIDQESGCPFQTSWLKSLSYALQSPPAHRLEQRILKSLLHPGTDNTVPALVKFRVAISLLHTCERPRCHQDH